MIDERRRRLLEGLLQAALAAAEPARVVPPHLPAPPNGRTIVIGAGKGAAAMARAVEDHWPGPLSGLVVTRHGHGAPCQRIEVVEAAHPVPDAAGRDAAGRILEMVHGLGAEDLILCLISGGGSALLAAPAHGITLAEKQAVNRALLRSGADIGEMNCVRKHLSAIKGGRLALAAAPAKLVTLMISDVPGDDPATIASGPTVADPTTFAEARAILEQYRIDPPESVRARLERADDETPKPGDSRLARAEHVIVARPRDSLEAAAEVARRAGLDPVILGDAIEGEARDVARAMARDAIRRARRADARDRPLVLLSGGETTVTVRGGGRGGRNAEFILAFALEIDGEPGLAALACDTDGIDGTEDNAGCLADGGSVGRGRRLGLDAAAHLADNDGYGFFAGLGDLVVTGPTLTNVNDFRAIVIEPVAKKAGDGHGKAG